MLTIRFLFERNGRLRFTSHLDMLRTFQRAFRRAGFKVSYSQGFNPHMDMVLGMPLGVGTTSTTEYADVGMDEKIDTDEFVKRLNQALPEGLLAIRAAYKTNKDNIMASIAQLTCEIMFEGDFQQGELSGALDRLLAKTEIQIEKTSKNGTKIVEIRGKIRAAKYIDEKTVELCCDSGSRSNLSPELFVAALKTELPKIKYFSVCRMKILTEKEGKLLDPMSDTALN